MIPNPYDRSVACTHARTNMVHRASDAALFVTLLPLAACAAPSDEDLPSTGRTDHEIVNGQIANGDPAVVALVGNNNFLCTGTLIRPTVVLTAAHCVPPHISQFGVTSYGQMSVFFGTNLGGSGELRQVVEGWTHPGWSENVIEDDIALLRLASAGPATPIPFNEAALGGIDQGAQIRILGFGMTGAEQFNTIGPKREALTTIAEVYPYVFTLDSAPGITCNGDSGGTTLMVRQGQEVVVGIHSRSDCVSSAIDTRVDEYTTIIYDFLGETPGGTPQCHADGQCATGCGAPDPDCPCAGDGFCGPECADPAADPDCSAPCTADGVCDATCVSDPDCETPCPADGICDGACAPDPDCGDEPPPPAGEGWVAGDVSEEDYDEIDGGGCNVGSPRRGSNAMGAWWMLLGLGLWTARRRR